MDAEPAPLPTIEPAGGPGAKVRAPSGLTEIRDARLTQRALEEGWIGGTRWPTRIGSKQLHAEIQARGDATLIEQTVATAYRLLGSEDTRAKGIGAKIAVTMEAQNQADEHHAAGHKVEHTGAIGVAVQVIEDPGWYGNNAHDLPSQAAIPSATDPALTSAIQSPGLRAPLGQDGDGVDGELARSRADEGVPQRCD